MIYTRLSPFWICETFPEFLAPFSVMKLTDATWSVPFIARR